MSLRPSSQRGPHHDGEVDLSVIVVSYNTAALIDEMMSSLLRASRQLRVQVIVVDNASTDDSVATFRSRYPGVELIESPSNIGFGRANNLALPHVRGRFVLLLNTDAFVAEHSLERSLAFMHEHPDCGVLGVKLIGRDGALQPSCRYFPTPWNTFLVRAGLARYLPHGRLIDDLAWDHSTVRDCDWVPGCFYLVRFEVVRSVGLFDPRYFLYSEEVDHCRAVKAKGWRVVYFPDTHVVHIGGESAKSAGGLSQDGRQLTPLQVESEMLYLRKHHGISGVLLSAVLEQALLVWQAAKHLLRRRAFEGLRSQWGANRLWWRTATRTRLGARPTR